MAKALDGEFIKRDQTEVAVDGREVPNVVADLTKEEQLGIKLQVDDLVQRTRFNEKAIADSTGMLRELMADHAKNQDK